MLRTGRPLKHVHLYYLPDLYQNDNLGNNVQFTPWINLTASEVQNWPRWFWFQNSEFITQQ